MEFLLLMVILDSTFGLSFGMGKAVVLLAPAVGSNNPPWFCTSLPDSTTDDLEVRICGDKTTAHEDTLITRLELYVKQLATLYDFNE